MPIVMNPPAGPVTARVYDDLPEVYREADELQVIGYTTNYDLEGDSETDGNAYLYGVEEDGTSDDARSLVDAPPGGDSDEVAVVPAEIRHPLRRYLATLLEQLTPVDDALNAITSESLAERFPPLPYWRRIGTGRIGDGTIGDAVSSALVDPVTAPQAWLPWLAQALGQDITGLSPARARERLSAPSWEKGTPRVIAAAVRAAAGARYVDVVTHYQGDPFVIAVVYRGSELTGATWGQIEQNAPTWADWHRAGTWRNLARLVTFNAVENQRPAGYRLILIDQEIT